MDSEKLIAGAFSRRELLTAAGAAALAALTPGGLVPIAEATGGATEKWPWPYEKLDPQATAELAYSEWYRVYCGAAVISSVFTQLRDKLGGPYASFPVDSFVFLEGGMAGWGTICGSNAGANIVSNCIIGPRTAGPECENGAQIGADTLQWYSDTPLPVFDPKQPRQGVKIIQTTSGSPLCHVSVGRWMKASGYALSSPERRDRCARVSASVAYQLVQRLNDWKGGRYEPLSQWRAASSVGITAQQNCTGCHSGSVPSAPRT